MNTEFFDGTIISVSTDTTRLIDLINAVTYTLEDIYGDRDLFAEDRADALAEWESDNPNFDDLTYLFDSLEAELEQVANVYGYTFGTLEGDGAHYVLAPLTPED